MTCEHGISSVSYLSCRECNNEHELNKSKLKNSQNTKGWECPRCHAVMAPNMPMCLYCKPQEVVNPQVTEAVTSTKPKESEK